MRTLAYPAAAIVLLVTACGGDGGGDTDLAAELAPELESVTGLPPDAANCAAELVVEEIGEDELRDAGFPEVDPDEVDPELTERLSTVMLDAIVECDVDLVDLASGGSPFGGDVDTRDDATGGSQTTEPTGSELVVVDAGFSTYEWVDETWATAAATLRNDGEDDGARVEVTVTLRSADGSALVTETTTAEYVPPGGEAHVVVDIWEDVGGTEPVEIDIELADSTFPNEGVDLPIEVRDIVLERGSAEVRGSVSNPTDERVTFAEVHCVLVGDGGIVGGIQGSIDPVAPGGDVAFEVSDFFDDTFAAHAAECSAGATL